MMKKIFSLLMLTLLLSFAGQAQILFPFGSASTVTATADSGDETFSVFNNLTILDAVTVQSDTLAQRNFALTISDECKAGAMLFAKIKTKGASVTTFSTGFTAPNVTGVDAKTKCILFVYDGTSFKPVGTAIQID